jgi:Histidine kinase-, DNA gyrase B-, and HSP90-like ATPase
VSSNLTLIAPNRIQKVREDWAPITDAPIIGKDVLELLSSSMYVNVLSVYREYVQNAADSIDTAKESGVLSRGAGRVHLSVDPHRRVARIRDNGVGLRRNEFAERLVAVGASKKRGSRARGFRGVGRLAGLAYCQELIFRAKAVEDTHVSELRWDCRKLKALLRDEKYADNLDQLVRAVVTARTFIDSTTPSHFFEVELVGIVRHGNDVLMDTAAIQRYLEQIAPIPFAPQFSYGVEIDEILKPHVNLGNVEITVNDAERPLYRPYRDRFEARKGVSDRFESLQKLSIPGSDGAVAALGWILHHGYLGAFPKHSQIKGLRLRSGNLQIGEAELLDEIFPEPRFNSWAVGEVHILDDRILPNGRRDHFEQNVHFRNVLGQLTPIARELGHLCRDSSVRRNWVRQFEQGMIFIKDRQAILRQGAISESHRAELRDEIVNRAAHLEKIATAPILDPKTRTALHKRLVQLNAKLPLAMISKSGHGNLKRFRGARRHIIQRLVEVVYNAVPNPAAAKLLVDKILRRL